MGAGVSVGSAVEVGNVGNGGKVTVPKLNKAVGVTSVPSPGKTTGLATTFEGLRDRTKLSEMEHRQQRTRRSPPARTNLPLCPCSSYVFFNPAINELSCSIILRLRLFAIRNLRAAGRLDLQHAPVYLKIA